MQKRHEITAAGQHAAPALLNVVTSKLNSALNEPLHAAQLWETRLVWTALLAIESVLTMLGSNAFLCALALT